MINQLNLTSRKASWFQGLSEKVNIPNLQLFTEVITVTTKTIDSAIPFSKHDYAGFCLNSTSVNMTNFQRDLSLRGLNYRVGAFDGNRGLFKNISLGKIATVSKNLLIRSRNNTHIRNNTIEREAYGINTV